MKLFYMKFLAQFRHINFPYLCAKKNFFAATVLIMKLTIIHFKYISNHVLTIR